MNTGYDPDLAVSRIAAAIGEPARVRMLYSLLDGHARTSTELAVVAEVSPSTTSAHLNRLTAEHLIKVYVQGKHRYHSLASADVARTLEGLSALAGGPMAGFMPNTPSRLRMARTCYDHIAGTLGVLLHNRFKAMGWLTTTAPDKQSAEKSSTHRDDCYFLTVTGTRAVEALGIDVAAMRSLRRRLAYACLDWSERQPHIGGALGAALLHQALKRKWVRPDPDSRALSVTSHGQREMRVRFGLQL